MNRLHSNRLNGQVVAMYKTVMMLRKIKPTQFCMNVTLGLLNHTEPKVWCNSYGGIAGHCVVANLGPETINNKEFTNINKKAKQIMGLSHEEAEELLAPSNKIAHHECEDENDPRHITQRRGILVMWYFVEMEKIEWDNETLKRYVAAHPLPPMRGVTI